MPDPAIQLTASLDLPRVARGAPTTVRLVAEVAAAERTAPADRPPLAVVLALDTSGSMQGEKLRHLVRSVELVVDHLAAQDQIGIVCFSNTARIALPLMPRAAWQPAAIAGLCADGGTSIEAGLRLAADLCGVQAARARSAIVLLSDGQPNIGASTALELAAIARTLRDRASVATLGYGEDHSDQVLASIAESGGGGYAYIPQPEQCRVELARVLGAQIEVVADRVRLVFEPADGLPGAGELRLPDFCAGDRRIAIFDLALPALPALGSTTLGRLVLHHRPTGGDPTTIATSVAVEVAESAGPRDPVAHGLGLVREGELARAEATRLADTGAFEAAARVLGACVDRIRAALPASAMPRLAELHEQLIDDLALLAQRPDANARRAYRRGQHGLAPQHASSLLASAYGPVPKATLIFLGDRRAPIVLRREMTFGRTTSADVQLSSGMVSRLHTKIVASDGAFWVNDLGSSNGTRLNGAPVHSQRLADGDVIEVGDVKLLFRAG